MRNPEEQPRIEASNNLEVEPKPENSVYVTSTWYPDEKPTDDPTKVAMDTVRQNLALESFREILATGHQVVIVDENSGGQFRTKVAELGIELISAKDRGMANCRRQALLEASQREGAQFLFWIEPEKISYIQFMQQMAVEMARKGADIGIPTRDLKIFEQTYPGYQFESEMRANRLINGYLHHNSITPQNVDYDWFFGPKVIRNTPEIVELFSRKYGVEGEWVHGIRRHANPEKYTNVLFFPVLEAILDPKLSVIPLDPIDFEYPWEQKANETNFPDEESRKKAVDRRRGQFYGILGELIHFARLKSDSRVVQKKSILTRVV